MKLLVVTQKVDKSDPVLGFFHSWLVGFSEVADRILVICLEEGEHNLPENVRVISLGKEEKQSKIQYITRFYRYVSVYLDHYDSVFVHMNQEYVIFGGILWRLFGKRIVLWRNHAQGSLFTRLAGLLAHVVCYTSESAYVARFTSSVRMPIGIDTGMFDIPRTARENSVLFLGRFDSVKNPDIFLKAMSFLEKKGTSVHANVYGDPTPGRERYAEELKSRFGNLKSVSFHSGVRNDVTPGLYASHDVYVNLTPSGSFDKTIGEALAAGCVVVAANAVVRDVLPNSLFVQELSEQKVARALKIALGMSEEERKRVRTRGRAYIEREHSFTLLVDKLFGILKV